MTRPILARAAHTTVAYYRFMLPLQAKRMAEMKQSMEIQALEARLRELKGGAR